MHLNRTLVHAHGDRAQQELHTRILQMDIFIQAHLLRMLSQNTSELSPFDQRKFSEALYYARAIYSPQHRPGIDYTLQQLIHSEMNYFHGTAAPVILALTSAYLEYEHQLGRKTYAEVLATSTQDLALQHVSNTPQFISTHLEQHNVSLTS